MSRSESIADWSPSAASSVAPVLDGDQSACSPRECLNQFTRSTCPTNGDHLIPARIGRPPKSPPKTTSFSGRLIGKPRQAHILKVAGSNPAPAPNLRPLDPVQGPFCESIIELAEVCLQTTIERRKVLVRKLPDNSAQTALSHLADPWYHRVTLFASKVADRHSKRKDFGRNRGRGYNYHGVEHLVVGCARHDNTGSHLAHFRWGRVAQVHPHHCATLHGFFGSISSTKGADSQTSIAARSSGLSSKNCW